MYKFKLRMSEPPDPFRRSPQVLGLMFLVCHMGLVRIPTVCSVVTSRWKGFVLSQTTSLHHHPSPKSLHQRPPVGGEGTWGGGKGSPEEKFFDDSRSSSLLGLHFPNLTDTVP